MKANPGGIVDPNSVIGRDELIQQIWKALDRQCVLLNAERRIGKTSMIRKMTKEPHVGWFPVYQDLESIHSAAEFSTSVYDQIQRFLGVTKRGMNLARKFYDDHDFGDLAKKKERPWKHLLIASIDDLVAAKADQRLVLFWDEVPYMIANIGNAEGQQVAAEVLDTLRSLRNKYPKDLRMVFTGSIGLHHVLSGMHDAKIATEPVNDMIAIEVAPLDTKHAQQLARDLIKGEGIMCNRDAIEATTLCIAKELDGFPFYIHHVINSLSLERLAADPETVRNLIRQRLVDPTDPWELGHYRERIRIYYQSASDAQLVALVLDCMCDLTAPCSLGDLMKNINAQSDKFSDRSHVIRVLRLMERDHYLGRDTDGRLHFRFPLIQRWWKVDRGFA